MDEMQYGCTRWKATVLLVSAISLLSLSAAQVQVGPGTSTTHPDINLTINYTATANYTTFDAYPDNMTFDGSNFSIYHTASPPNETVVEMPWYNRTPTGGGDVTDIVVNAEAGQEMHVMATDLTAGRDFAITHEGTTIYTEDNSDGTVSATFTMNSSADTLAITQTSTTGGADRGNWTRTHSVVGGEAELQNGTIVTFLGPGDAVDADITAGTETRSFALGNGTNYIDVAGMEGDEFTVFLDLQNDTVSTDTPRVESYSLEGELSEPITRFLDLGPILFAAIIIIMAVAWAGFSRAG